MQNFFALLIGVAFIWQAVSCVKLKWTTKQRYVLKLHVPVSLFTFPDANRNQIVLQNNHLELVGYLKALIQNVNVNRYSATNVVRPEKQLSFLLRVKFPKYSLACMKNTRLQILSFSNFQGNYAYYVRWFNSFANSFFTNFPVKSVLKIIFHSFQDCRTKISS